ncbi:MFS transporter, partial [Staphylococcus capitis]|uniref:MFS transporter n=1 Tax=Staphylococcus capitis TaxID=29388 RepID=UPI0021B1D447
MPLLFIIPPLTLPFSTNLPLLILPPLIIPFPVPPSISTLPLYLTQIPPTQYPPSFPSLNQLIITIPILPPYLLNYAFPNIQRSRSMLGLPLVPSVILLIRIYFMP